MRTVLVALLAVLLFAPAVAPAAARAPMSIMQDDARLLRSGPAVRDQTLDGMRALGVQRVRVMVVWRDVAAHARRLTRPARVDAEAPANALAPLRDLAAAGRARGLGLLVTVTGPGPAWASGCRGSAAARQLCRPDPRRFARFVAAVGRALPQQRVWSIWNEPNAATWLLPQTLHGRAVSPGLYRGLLRAAARALAATGHGRDTVLIGETAPIGHTTGPEASRPMPPGRFIRALFCGLRRGACQRLPGTGFAHHLYPASRTPVRCDHSPSDVLGPTALPQLHSLLRRAAAAGLTRRRLPLWITEAGVQSSPPDRFFGVPLPQQAEDVNAIEWLATRAGTRSVAQYLLVDEPALGSFQSGLWFADGRPKPARDAYRLPVWVRPVRDGVRVWGRARAARASDPVVVTVERRAPGDPWRSVRTVTATGADHAIDVRLRGSARGWWRLRAGGSMSRSARARGTTCRRG